MEGQGFTISDKWEGTKSVVEGFSPKNPDLPWRRPRCNIAKLFSAESSAHALQCRAHHWSPQAFAKLCQRDAVRHPGQPGREAEQHRAQPARRYSSAQDRRPSRNLQAQELETHLRQQLLRLGSRRVESNTVLRLDLSDVHKEYARKMEFLDQVWDGSAGEVHPGYWLCSVLGAEVHGSELTPLYQQLFSVRAQDFVSENDELLSAIDQLRAQTRGRGIWAMDRGGDRRKLLEPLLERRERFVMRSTGLDRQRHRVTLHPSGGLLPAPLSGQNYQDRKRPGESVRAALRRGTVPPAGPRRAVAVGGGRRLRARTALAADQPVRSAGLAIAMVDRTNLPDAVET